VHLVGFIIGIYMLRLNPKYNSFIAAFFFADFMKTYSYLELRSSGLLTQSVVVIPYRRFGTDGCGTTCPARNVSMEIPLHAV